MLFFYMFKNDKKLKVPIWDYEKLKKVTYLFFISKLDKMHETHYVQSIEHFPCGKY